MQPILEQQKKDELAQMIVQKKSKEEEMAKAKKEEDAELEEYVKSKDSNSELHKITQKLGSFTDMANSLKTTIDDVSGVG
jgi:hypothetical protein